MRETVSATDDHATTVGVKRSCWHRNDLDPDDNSQSVENTNKNKQSNCSSCKYKQFSNEGKRNENRSKLTGVDNTEPDHASCICRTVKTELAEDVLMTCDKCDKSTCDNNSCRKECDYKKICDNKLAINKERLFCVCDRWPLVCDSHVIVNLTDAPWDKFKSGDFYLHVKQTESKTVGLWVSFCIGNITGEIQIPESDFGKIFTMEWKEEVLPDTTEELGKVLRNCLVMLEDSTEKLRWEDVVPQTGQFHHGSTRLKQSNVHSPGINGSYQEKSKSIKDHQNNCVKCDKLSEQENNVSGSHGNGWDSGHHGYSHSKEYSKSSPNSPGMYSLY